MFKLKILRIIFAGTPFFAASYLEVLFNTKNKYKIVGVLTQPDKPSGRGKKIIYNPVKIFTNKFSIPIFQPITFQTKEIQDWIKNKNADIMIVVAYGLIIPTIILNIFPLGCINVHYSLLPYWRGAAPIQRSILAGDKETGITVIQMDTGLDTGDILYKISCVIDSNDTTNTLCKKLTQIGLFALIKTLELLVLDKLIPQKQNNTIATYAKKISKHEALIDWYLSAIQIIRYIKAFDPWPGSYFIFKNYRIKIWHAEIIEHNSNLLPGTILNINKTGIQIVTAVNVLNILKIQIAGKKIMFVKEFFNSSLCKLLFNKYIL